MGRRHRAEFEFLELRTFLSAGWDITLIDSTVGNQAVLRRALVPGGRVILYNGKTDSAADVLTRVTDWAQETGSTIKSISLLSEGAPGRFELGNQWISNSTLLQTAPDWERLSQVLANDAVIKLYGCDLADPLGAGQRLIDRVASVTGAEVFATTNLIGRSGDWAFDAAVKQLNPLQSSSLIAFPSPTTSLGSSTAAMDVNRASVNRASLAITPGGAKNANAIIPPSASGLANYSVPKPQAIEAPAVGTIAGWTNRTEPTRDVVLLDTQVPDATALEKAVLPGTNLITYDGATESANDVLAQVIDWAQTNDVRIGSLSLLSHGNTGAFELGDQWITSTVLAQTAMEWRKLGDVLAPNASIDIFGCDVAAPGGDGQFLIDKIAKLTGGDVFASTNLTGKGGDWNLEAGSDGGEVSSASPASFPLNAAVAESYPDSLLLALSTAATASPSPVTGKTTSLSVMAVDLLGTGTLTYTWATTGTPPAAVTYSANGTSTSNDVTATFTKAGTYDFTVSMVDGSDTASSSVTVTVNQTATSVVVSPATAALNENQTQQFAATELDQFGNAMATQPTFTWAKASGVGSVSSSGLYTAPYGTGSASITATNGSLSGSASVTVTNATPTVATAASATPNPVTGTTTALSVLGADDGGESNLTYSWAVSSSSGATVLASNNDDNSAKNLTVTFTAAGTYSFHVTIADAQGASVTSSVTVTVEQTLREIVVLPSLVSVPEGTTQQCTAVGYDQFGNAMATQPTFSWSVSGGGSISQNGLYTAPAASGDYPIIKAASGSCTGLSQFITVASSANVVPPGNDAGKTASVNVAGYSDSYIYTWSVISKPSGAPTPTFSANASSSADATVVTFYQAGLYEYVCNFGNADGSGTRYCATFEATVEQTTTSITITPTSAALSENGTEQFNALAVDQFGNAMSPEPAFTWSVSSGAGTVTSGGLYTAPASIGTATVEASSGSANASASISVSSATDTCPGAQTTVEDTPLTFSSQNNNQLGASNTSNIAGLSVSSGTLTLSTISGLTFINGTSNGTDMVEFSGTAAAINAALNGLVYTPNNGFTGSDSLVFITGVEASGQPTVFTDNSIAISVSPAPPTVQTPAAANPSPVTGTSTALTVQGADDGGASNLTYAWQTTGNVPAPVTFSANDSNAANDTTATFSTAGTYNFTATITDGAGLSTTSSVRVVVRQKLTTIAVSPASAALNENQTQQFTAAGFDQFGQAMSSQPSFNWSETSGVGSINADGLYTAPSGTGSATIAATNGSVSGTASITVTNAAPTISTPAAANPSPVTGNATELSVLGADDGGESHLTYTWTTTGNPPAQVSFTNNGTNDSKYTIAFFSEPGTYHFLVTITDAGGLSTTSAVSVVVDSALANIVVSPDLASLNENQTQQFTAEAYDQFGNALATQPAITWSESFGVGSIDDNGLYTAPAGSGIAVISASSGSVSGQAWVSVTNAPPTVATAAAASPNPVTGTTAALSVLGADDGGESNLTYSWSVLSKPSGASAPSFSINGSNSAKNTVATFSQSGTYRLEATITDAGGLSTTSTVSVSVDQTFTSISVSPTNSSLAAGGTQQFSATALDQFGLSMAQQPSINWAASDGVISSTGFFIAPPTAEAVNVSATSGSVSGSTTVTIVGSNTAVASPSTVTGNTTTLSVSGGATSGVTYTWSVSSEPSGVASPTFSVNGSGAAQTTTATFSAAGDYTFQVAIDAGSTTTHSVNVIVDQTLSAIEVSPSTSNLHENGKQSFSAIGFDQFAQALTTQPDFSWDVSSGGGTIDGNGVYTAAGSGGAGSATIAAVDGSISGSANITVTNAAPTIANAAAASPSVVTGTTSRLSVLGADDGGESNLTYTWTTVGTPAAAVSFSANGSNDAKNTTATFTVAGDYQFLVTVEDAEGLSTTSSVSVSVNQTLTQLVLSPASATIIEGQSQQFAAAATDQFGNSMPDPSLLWSVRSGTGYIDSTGMFTAASTPGTTTISASSGNVRANATITVPNEAPTVATAAKASPNLVTGTSTVLNVLGADDGGESNLTYTWSTYGTSPAAVTFSANSSNAAKSTTAHFTKAGDYQFLVTITDAQGLSTSSTTSVTVNQTLTHLAVSPTAATVAKEGTEPFSATATDQFGHSMAAPTLTWSVRSGVGTIDGSGLFTAGSVPGTVTIAAASGNVSSTAMVTIPNEPPTVATAASASPSPVTGTTTTLSVLGADDGGESNLTYTWSTSGTPPAAVSFSTNSTNGAKNATATFSAPGNYEFVVTITDAEGATTSSSLDVVVSPTLASIKVTSAEPSAERGQTVQFAATALDQFGTPLANQPTFSWTTDSNVGSIDPSGNYTAPIAGTGTVNAIATTGGVRGTASIKLMNQLATSAPTSASTTPGVPFVFDQSHAITVSDGDPQTADIPVSITISATHGTINLSDTSGLTFSSGTGTGSALMTFTGTISDINTAIHGMSYTPDTGFSGMASVMVAFNEVGNGKQTPSSPILIDVAAAVVTPSSTTTGSSGSNSASTLGDESDTTPTTPTPSQTTTPTSTSSSSSSTVATPATTSGGVDGTSSSGGSVAHVTPAPAKPADNAQKPAEAPAQQAVNANANPAPAVAMPNLAAAVPDVRVESVPEQVFPFLSARSEMSKELDKATDNIVSEKKIKIVAGSATVASFGASAAYVLWMLRGGSLLSSLLSILPAWQSIDPLPVLDNFESKKRRKKRMNSDGDDAESLESMVDKSNSDAEKDAGAQEQA